MSLYVYTRIWGIMAQILPWMCNDEIDQITDFISAVF